MTLTPFGTPVLLHAVADLAHAARTVDPEAFEAAHGPAALVTKVSSTQLERARLLGGVTTTSHERNRLDDMLVMLRSFSRLTVTFLRASRGHLKWTIGRVDSCQVALDDPSVSKLHATIEQTATGWRVHDAGSRNGTFVNGERLTTAPAVITDGDVLAFGDTQLIFVTTRTLHAQLLGVKV